MSASGFIDETHIYIKAYTLARTNNGEAEEGPKATSFTRIYWRKVGGIMCILCGALLSRLVYLLSVLMNFNRALDLRRNVGAYDHMNTALFVRMQAQSTRSW